MLKVFTLHVFIQICHYKAIYPLEISVYNFRLTTPGKNQTLLVENLQQFVQEVLWLGDQST